MEGGTQHWRPFKALWSEEMEEGIQEKHLRDFTDAAHGGVGGFRRQMSVGNSFQAGRAGSSWVACQRYDRDFLYKTVTS